MVDEAGLGRVFDAEGSALPSMDDGPRGGDARVRFGDERRTSSLPRDGGGGGRRRKADVGYPLAALGDAASETLRGLGADPRASPNRPEAAALGGARKPGSDVFLDDFTRSFEDQWGDDLDAAEAKRAEKARRRRAKAEAAKAEAAKAEAAKAEAERAEAERAEAERAEEAARAARAKARADAKAERRAAVKAAAAEAAAAEKAAAEKAAAEKAEARSTAAALGRSRTKTSSSSKTSKTSKTSKSPKPAEAKLAKAKSSTRASSKRSRRRATAPVVDIVDIDDLFDAIERGKVGAASVEPDPEPEPSAGDYGDYDVGDGDDYGDYDDTPETKPEVKRLRGSRKKTLARRNANEPTSTDSETDDTSLSDASALIADDDVYRFDVPGVDETAVRMYEDGGREYFNDLYEKGADWVNAKYETAANTTQLWVDEYEESGRSKTRLKVDVFLDAADPYSLELVLGPIQNLLRMDLGPLAWTFHAHSNVGQNRGRRANCGGEIAGSAARVSCVANAAVQCSQDVFQNMTSGLGRFEKRAEEIAARRAQVKRAKAALGATKTKSSSFSENESETSDVLTSNRRLDDEARLVRAPHTSRARTSRGVLSVEVAGEEDYAATPSPSEDYVKQDTFVDLFEPDDDASSYDSGYDADDLDVSSYDVPSLPSLFSDGGEEGEERDEFANGGLSRFDDTTAPLNVFLTCLSTKLLEMESASAFAFGDANKERSLLDMSATCCETAVQASVSAGGMQYEHALLATCREQASCLATDRGFSLLSNASDALEALTPKHKWLPWVLVEQKPVCVHSCNLQQGIRRAVCNNREGTLPSDCPRFPWSKIWYDEPGVSFAGVFGVFFGLALVAFSMALLAQQAGCCARRKKRDEPEFGVVDENSPLLGSPAAKEKRSEEDKNRG
jgi:hypothetical protein